MCLVKTTSIFLWHMVDTFWFNEVWEVLLQQLKGLPVDQVYSPSGLISLTASHLYFQTPLPATKLQAGSRCCCGTSTNSHFLISQQFCYAIFKGALVLPAGCVNHKSFSLCLNRLPCQREWNQFLTVDLSVRFKIK